MIPPIAHRSDTPLRSEAEQRSYFDAVLERAIEAEARAGARTRCYDVAGIVIRIVFAGPVLEDVLTPAIAHLEIPVTTGDVAFHVWDSASTGVAMLPPPCGHGCFTDRGDIWGMASEHTRIAYHWSDYALALGQDALAECVYWVSEADCIPYWGRASPLRTLFHWAMQWHGRHLLHAAAIGTADGALLITGKGGVGKSTTALCGLTGGLRYVGDDYVIVSLDPSPEVISLYATAKLNPDQIARFPDLAGTVANASRVGAEKAVLQLHPRFTGQIARRMKLRAVVTPEIIDQTETSFAPADGAQLVHAASFTTISQLPHSGRQTHDFIDRLVNEVPGFTLRLGHDLAAIPAAIAGILERPMVAARPRAPDRVASVSVIIPVHDGAHFLSAAVDSVIRQGWSSIDLVIIDDGSHDAIEEAVAALPIAARLFRNPNAGPAAARNHGIRNAFGDLIAFLDVDDLWPQGRLDAMVHALRDQPKLDVVRGHAQLFRWDQPGPVMHYIGNPEESFGDYIGGAVYRRQVFERVGLFDPELRYGEDTDWFNRAAEERVGVARLPMVTLLVQRHDRNMTRGKSLVQLNKILVFKKLIDRKREQGRPAP